ncbi:MAG: HAD-IG family 5'-nucleotidase [Myxococcales bacterium]|nr:HAD-IG family 5'-nucleotidase [Myxococcales bacterium]MDD9968874.1 HAD-IG family 5'-nucleotidase [Myxococcales bacterium]
MRRYGVHEQQLLPLPELALPSEAELPFSHRIYCNRDLRLDLIEAVGFDMDYTLVVYDQEAMDRLSIEATAKKLVARGYPESLLAIAPRLDFPIRGLLVDTKLGNILKTDRYSYPKKAYHGTRELSSEQRRRAYNSKRIRPGTRRYHCIDTLYALSEVTLYAAAIDALDHGLSHLDYARLFADVRASIDEAHRDGSIKDRIMADPGKFVTPDPDLAATLHRLRSAGKRLFLLTNSGPEYTDVMMDYLLSGESSRYSSWRSYFDIVATDARKPGFFTGDAPFAHSQGTTSVEGFERGKMYCGGSLRELERLAGAGGDRILYVGDHIYGDVLRAKKNSAWRTLMVIHELADELRAIGRFAGEIDRMHRLNMRRYDLLDRVREQQARLKSILRRVDIPGVETQELIELEAMRARVRRVVDRDRVELKALELEYLALERAVDHGYHPFWGSVFKAESELSSFGEQVERYACLYTDRVSNLVRYSPGHFFRGPRHRMAHEH